MLCGEQLSIHDSHSLFALAADRGVSAWDTAEMYPIPQREATQGRSEEILGTWLRSQRRDTHWLLTKVAGPGSMTWLRGGPLHLSRRNIAEALEASLMRLQTDFVDCLLLHWPDRYRHLDMCHHLAWPANVCVIVQDWQRCNASSAGVGGRACCRMPMR
jgi:aryl-alcohol dehydrogenase-like predicted oxidoreductase